MDGKRIDLIFDTLNQMYPDAHCELNFNSDFELLIAVILSAQCTDKRVNIVSKELFKKYNTPFDFAKMNAEELEPLIRSCGFYRMKAKSIISASQDIITKYGGKVPNTMETLLTLRGVGRKTANVVLSVAFDKPAMAVDTHVLRTAVRLGLSDKTTPEGVEWELLSKLPEDKLNSAHHLLIFLGRYCCHSRNPDCGNCKLSEYCEYYIKRKN